MKKLFLAVLIVLAAQGAKARDYTAGEIAVLGPAARAMLPGAKVGGGYLSIRNSGGEADVLVSVSSDRAKSVQLHEMSVNGGIMVMREAKQGLELPPGETVELKPGGYHLMFMDVEKPFKEGEQVRATLTFQKAGSVDVEFAVGSAFGPIGAAKAEQGGMKGMDMSQMDMGDDAQQTIPARLKAMFETPEKPLTVNPVVVQGDWAIAGWIQDGRGGRALLKNGPHGWSVYLCSGDGITEANALQKVGLSAADASALSSALKAAEAKLDTKTLQLFSSFEGTVLMEQSAGDAGHGGHEGHAQ